MTLSRAALELTEEELFQASLIEYDHGIALKGQEFLMARTVAAVASAKVAWAIVAWLRLAYRGAPGVLLARSLAAALEQAGVREPRQG